MNWGGETCGGLCQPAFANAMRGEYDLNYIKTGLRYMEWLVGWYQEQTAKCSVGFFQVGGGIAGASLAYLTGVPV